MRVGIIDAQEEGLVVFRYELLSEARVIPQLFPSEVGTLDFVHVKREGRSRIDMQFANQPGSITYGFQTAGQVVDLRIKQPKAPGGQADLAVLMGIQTG